MRSKKAVTAASGLLSVLLLNATLYADTLTRGGAVQRALLQNPQVAAAKAQEAQAAARRGQAHAAQFPEITVVVGTGPSLQADLVPGSAIESTQNAYGDVGFDDLSIFLGGQIQILQPLYTFGKIGLRGEAAEHEIRARQAQTDMTRADVARQVAELYESLLFARDAQRFFEETRHWLQKTLEDVEASLGHDPQLSEQDILRLKTALSVVILGLNQATAGVNQARAGLAAYLALKPESIETQEQSLEPLPTKDFNEAALIGLALARRPEVRALEQGSAAYEKLAEAEEAGNLPDFFALGMVSGFYTPGRDLVDTRFAVDPLNHFVPGAMLGLRWKYQAGISSHRADVSRAQATELARTRDWAVLGMPAEVTKAHQDLVRARRDMDEVERAVQQAKQWAVRASADFGIGLGSTRDVTEASEAYAQLRIAQFHAIFRHNVALAELAKVTGTLTADDGRFYPTKSHAVQAHGVQPARSTPSGSTQADSTQPDPKQGAGDPSSSN